MDISEDLLGLREKPFLTFIQKAILFYNQEKVSSVMASESRPLIHQASCKLNSMKREPTEPVQTEPFCLDVAQSLPLSFFYNTACLWMGKFGSKHAILLLLGYFAQAVSVKTLLSSP